jgi:O-antigen/teichoic acid export membrane protein
MLEPLRAARAALLSIGWILVFGVVAEGPRFFELLYDARYVGAGEIAQWAAVAVWFMVLSTTAERALPAVGDPRGIVSFNLVKLLATVPLALVGFWLGDLPGFVLGLAAGAALAHARLLQQLHRHGLPLVRQDVCYTASLAAAGLFAVAVGPAAGRAVPLGNELLTTAIVGVAAIFALARLRELPH